MLERKYNVLQQKSRHAFDTVSLVRCSCGLVMATRSMHYHLKRYPLHRECVRKSIGKNKLSEGALR